jgi:DNA polymerase
MTTRLNPEVAASVQARLRYYRDLGVYDFYRRGEPLALLQESDPATGLDTEPDPLPAPQSAATPPPSVQHVSPTVTESEIPDLSPRAARSAVPQNFLPAQALQLLREEIGDCTRCPLAFQGRHTIVFGDGDPQARLLFVGEGPGADEDAQGLPFVGRAGQLLNNMITAMGLSREQVYIANIVKCRPPQNRTPDPEEARTCSPFLFRQIEIVKPEVIVALGATAATYLLNVKSSLAALRGRIHTAHNSKLIVTYHPAYLLRDPRQKKETWIDLQIAMRELGLKPAKPAGD